MENMQEQIGAILSNPEMMQKIKTLAQSLNQVQNDTQDVPHMESESTNGYSMPNIDISLLQKISGLAGQSNIDSNQRSLLSALAPYLSRNRIAKLEKAMRASKLASLASTFLNSSSPQLHTGR